MQTKFQVLVVEGNDSGVNKLSSIVNSDSYAVATAGSCEKALNQMLEYMDVVVIDARVDDCVKETLEAIKTRVRNTAVIVVAPGAEAKRLSMVGTVRADAYLALEHEREFLVSAIREAYESSSRAKVALKRGQRRLFNRAA